MPSSVIFFFSTRRERHLGPTINAVGKADSILIIYCAALSLSVGLVLDQLIEGLKEFGAIQWLGQKCSEPSCHRTVAILPEAWAVSAMIGICA